MSRRPGIGKDWLEKYRGDTNKDFITFNGMKMKLPKYYDNLNEIFDEEKMKGVKAKRIRKAREKEHDNTMERLGVKEKVKEAQMKTLRRLYENES